MRSKYKQTVLIYLQVRASVISCILSFPEFRQQKVSIFWSLRLSNMKTVNAGVPQGTKLGPILFIVIINDACHDVYLPFYKYVDDLTIVESRNVTSQSKLQNVITDLYQWSVKNNMTLESVQLFLNGYNIYTNKWGRIIFNFYWRQRINLFSSSQSLGNNFTIKPKVG